MSDLLLKDTILGMLQARAVGPDRYKIHASDFKKVLNEVGLDWGSPLAEDIMITCKTDSMGSIDFSGLEVQLKIERGKHEKLVAVSKLHRGPVPGTARTHLPVPLNDTEHESTSNYHYDTNSNQIKLVNIYRNEIHQLYKDFQENRNMSTDDVIQRIQALGFITSQSFYILLNNNKAGSSLQFRDFLQVLINCGDESLKNQNYNAFSTQPVAGVNRRRHDNQRSDFNEIFTQGKRVAWTNIEPAASDALSLQNVKQSKACGIQPLTAQREDALHAYKTAPKRYTNANQSDIFHTQDKSKKLSIGDGLSSEQKIIREQILVAIRKLDLNEISLNDFKQQVLNLGIVISNEITKELIKYKSSGILNSNRLIFLFDEICLTQKLSNKEVEEVEFTKVKATLLNAMKSSREYDLLKLFLRMKECDVDKSGTLSLGEFISSLRSTGVLRDLINDSQARILFNMYESINGSGAGLDHVDFISGLIGSITENLKRFKYVKWVFPKCDKKNQGFFSLEDLLDQINLDGLDLLLTPSTQDGEKALKKLVSFFTYFENGSVIAENVKTKRPADVKVVFETLALYFQAISAGIDDDSFFIDGIKTLFNLSDKFPSSYTNKMNAYGDFLNWETEVSQLEIKERESVFSKTALQQIANPHPSIPGYAKEEVKESIHHWNDKPPPATVKLQNDEWVRDGLRRVDPGTTFFNSPRNLSDATNIFWDINKRNKIPGSIDQTQSPDNGTRSNASAKKPQSLSQLASNFSSSNSSNSSNISSNSHISSNRLQSPASSPPPSFHQSQAAPQSPIRHKTLDWAVANPTSAPVVNAQPTKSPVKSLADYASKFNI